MGTRLFAALLCVATLTACSRSGPAGRDLATGPKNGDFTAEIAGRTIHYEVRGHGPVLMTVPNSWGLSLEGLRGLYRPLEDRLTMIYFDPRGMGGSAPVTVEEDMGLAAVREDFQALRAHLGLGRVNAIGWSNGAMNLILLAADQPETLASAVFVHGVPWFSAEDGLRFAAAHPELSRKWAAMEASLRDETLSEEQRSDRMKAFWLTEYFPAALADPRDADLLQRAFGPATFSYAHAAYDQRTQPTFDARDRLARITVRSLVIAGAADMLAPERVKALADGVHDATFVLFEHSGHFAPLEEPARFKKVVVDFVEGRPAPLSS